MDSLPEVVRSLLGKFTALWWDTDTSTPVLRRSYTLREQLSNEKQLDRALNALLSEARQPPQTEAERLAAQERIATTATNFAKAALDLEERHIHTIREYGFAEILVEFAQMAHRFDSGLSDEDIFQASRNVWSMNFMQLVLDRPIQLTPAIFAYSMLYPYTDNYLDAPRIPAQTKNTFNQRFKRRLAGEQVAPANPQEKAISDLIAMIEDQFERSRYPLVYDSLLAIHAAQGKSLHLLHSNCSPYDIDVLGICFEKGGTSVLADGYLIAGELTPSQQEFMFFYGTLTQLMDDLEDARQDQKDGLMTIFSQTARHWPLDTITNRTLHYGNHFLRCLENFAPDSLKPLEELMERSILPLIIYSAGSLGRFYTRPYYRTLQEHFPFRFPFLEKQRQKLTRQGVSPIGLIKAFATSNHL